jgi:hypothetical protein
MSEAFALEGFEGKDYDAYRAAQEASTRRLEAERAANAGGQLRSAGGSGALFPEVWLSSLGVPAPLLLLGRPEHYEGYISATDADGIEYTPEGVSRFDAEIRRRAAAVHTTAPPWLARGISREFADASIFSQAARDWRATDARLQRAVRGGRQSPRDTVGNNGATARTSLYHSPSLQLLHDYQLATGTRLPVVLRNEFRAAKVRDTDEEEPFSQVSIQPTPRAWRNLGLHPNSDPEQVRQALAKRHIGAIIIDVAALQTDWPDAAPFTDIPDFVDRMAQAGLVAGVNVGVGSMSLAGLRGPVAKEMRQMRHAFLHSADAAGRTLIGETVALAAKRWANEPRPRTPAAPRRVVLNDGRFRRDHSFDSHTVIISTIRSLVCHAIRDAA